jgi:formylmethanofuran dehydrogenase subunit E
MNHSDHFPNPDLFRTLLDRSAAEHRHLCPRQVLGVRLGLFALRHLELALSDTPFDNSRKRLLTIVETDGCGADGIIAATDCTIGHRTMQVADYGKLAATVIDTRTKKAVRVRPRPDSRKRALDYPIEAQSRWHKYLHAYQVMPDEDLLEARPVQLVQSLEAILSKPGARTTCATCKEEIMNEREVFKEGEVYCKSCAGESYYTLRSQTDYGVILRR